MKSIMITGISGYLGTRLARKLKKKHSGDEMGSNQVNTYNQLLI